MAKLLKIPSKFWTVHEKWLTERLGVEKYHQIYPIILHHFTDLTELAPKFRQSMNRHLFAYGVPCLAIYTALRHSLNMDQTEALPIIEYIVRESAVAEIENSWMHRFLLKHLGGSKLIGKFYERNLSKLSEPNGWKAELIQSDRPSNLIIGFNMTHCGLFTYFKENDAPELGPIMCYADMIAASYMKRIKFERKCTIADGCSMCDFRYYRV